MKEPSHRGILLVIGVMCLWSAKCASADSYRFDAAWGRAGGGTNQFRLPVSLCVDGSTLYICDVNNSRMVRCSTTGTLFTSWPTPGLGLLYGPVCVRVDASHNLYITDVGSCHILKRGPGFSDLGFVGAVGCGDGQFNLPRGIALDPARSRLWVADQGNLRLSRWTMGTGLPTFDANITPTGAVALSYPQGLAVDAGSNLYVADTGHNRVLKFSPLGETLGNWTGFSAPQSVVVKGNYLYIADTMNNRVLKRGLGNATVCTIGTGAGLNRPYDVAVAADGKVYVADAYNNRIVRFKPNHAPLMTKVAMSPSLPRVGQSLTANVSSTDADGDARTYNYTWWVRAGTTGSFTKSTCVAQVLPASYTHRGDYWQARVRAWDGLEHSPWLTSANVRIAAAAPTALSATATATSTGAAINLVLTSAAQVGGTICNLAGREVAILPPARLPAGPHALLWNGRSTTGSHVPAGQYLAHVTAVTSDGAKASVVCPLAVR